MASNQTVVVSSSIAAGQVPVSDGAGGYTPGSAGGGVIYDNYSNRPASAANGTFFISVEGPKFIYSTATNSWRPIVDDVSLGTEPPLVASLAWVNQGAASAVDKQGQILFSCPTEVGTQFHGLSKVLAGASASCAVKPVASANSETTNSADYNICGVYLRESATGKIATLANVVHLQNDQFNPYVETGTWTDNTTRATATANFGVGVGLGSTIWLRIRISGANIIFESSFNGTDWLELNGSPVVKAGVFTVGPNESGLCFFPSFAANAGFTQQALIRAAILT